MPVEPPPCQWAFPPLEAANDEGLLALGADLQPGTLLAAYRAGVFPMPLDLDDGLLGWWSPDPRGVVPLDGFHVSRSLRRSLRRYDVTVDTAFARVVAGCADPARRGRWITDAVTAAYAELHALGWAHSVEAWDEDGTLAGGLYGVEVGGLFAAESKFHRRTDASKVALAALVERLREAGGPRVLDVQWTTDHLRTLGARDVPRPEYVRRLRAALGAPPAFT